MKNSTSNNSTTKATNVIPTGEDEHMNTDKDNDTNAEEKLPSGFHCPICMEYNSDETKKYQLESCQHIICRDCLMIYCVSKVNDGITNILCCSPSRTKLGNSTMSLSDAMLICNTPLTENDVRNMLQSEHSTYTVDPSKNKTHLQKNKTQESIWAKYKRFKFDAEHRDTARRCPTCNHPHIFEMESSESSSFDNRVTASDQDVFSSSDSRSQSGLFANGALSNIALWSSRRSPIITNLSSSITSSSSLSRDFNVSKNNKYTENTKEANIDNEGGENPAIDQVRKNAKQLNVRPKTRVVACLKCSTEFCYFHSNAHPNETCEEYLKRSQIENDLNSSYLRQHTKSCPTCNASVQKSGGCNQMKCSVCGTNFCWICLTIVDDGTFPTHFQWWNINGCPNMQLHEGLQPSKCVIFLSRLLSILQLALIGIPALILSMFSFIFCCCCMPRVENETRIERATQCISFWGNFLTFVAASPLALCGCMISGISWLAVNFLNFGKRMGIRARRALCGSSQSSDSNKETVTNISTSISSRIKSKKNNSDGNELFEKNGVNIVEKEEELQWDELVKLEENLELKDTVMQNAVVIDIEEN